MHRITYTILLTLNTHTHSKQFKSGKVKYIHKALRSRSTCLTCVDVEVVADETGFLHNSYTLTWQWIVTNIQLFEWLWFPGRGYVLRSFVLTTWIYTFIRSLDCRHESKDNLVLWILRFPGNLLDNDLDLIRYPGRKTFLPLFYTIYG